jgi:hypothetical protein
MTWRDSADAAQAQLNGVETVGELRALFKAN